MVNGKVNESYSIIKGALCALHSNVCLLLGKKITASLIEAFLFHSTKLRRKKEKISFDDMVNLRYLVNIYKLH